ncbi:protein FAR1-RELATED SEQUENCE 6-like [Eutrema salsugineum]|uniref:protein FAR1-RELATED SEQUENCE 6-like n=1 Tax=Eutrema salsugineum TaxID=72664 RepID=UPI000CED56FF|nr:protein FAR1-RELATED SEQUENCE 6-like [Eutrema salsugineum]
MSFADLVEIAYEDFGLDQHLYELQFSYMLSSEVRRKLPLDTPPVFVGNSRQLQSFLHQFQNENETVRLCVEIKEKVQKGVVDEDEDRDACPSLVPEEQVRQDRPQEGVEVGQDEEMHDEEEDLSTRFDGCEDPDGASSDDEEYGRREKRPDGESSDEEESLNLPPKKRGPTTIPDFQSLELSSLDLAVGQRYETKEDFEMRLKILSIAHKFDYNVDHSSKKLLTVKCWVDGCKWRVRASTVGSSKCFWVKTYTREHTCSVTVRSQRTRHATHEVLGRLYKDFVGGVGPKVLPNHVAEALTKRYSIKVDYWKAHRALKYARELVSGTSESGYEDLPSYLYMIRRANPGTLIKLEVDEEDRFKFMFLSFGASIQGFPFMRKVVVVDGTFLHGKYKGTLLLATTQDGNFNIFPVAFAVVDTENDESWEWFFTQLHRVIPDEGLAIISDRHKSIGNAIGKVYPLASRGICTYHLHKNIMVKFRGAETFKLVKKAATAYRLLEFNALFAQIQEANPALHAYLVKADICMWSRVHFQGDRYNFTTSNIAESLNKVLSAARGKPIVRLVDDIRSLLTRWFAKRRVNANNMATTLTTGVEKLLETYITSVNLTEKTCTCRRFDLDKIPCVHAIAAADRRKLSPISLCHHYYHTSYLQQAYAVSVMPRDVALPVPDEVATKICLPPDVRNRPGRPKKIRIKGAFEAAMASNRPRKIPKCGNCGQGGHNRLTCRA